MRKKSKGARPLFIEKLFGLLLLALILSLTPAEKGWAAKKIRIVATTSALASIVREIAQDKADVYFIASPHRDIHFIAPTPKDVMKLKKADGFVHAGLDLEAWRGPLLDAVGRTELRGPRGEKQIDVSKGISLLEVPASLSRAEGDIHLYGNPHYWIDPENGKMIANNIAEGLAKIFPEDRDFFRKNADEFIRKLDEKTRDWTHRMAPYQGTPVVTYHKSWSYFAQRFGLIVLDQLEPKPGIPPTPKHMAELVQTMKDKGVKIIIKESYQESRTPKKVAEETGATVLTLAQEVGETEEASDYSSMIEYDIRQLEGAIKPKKEKIS